MPEYSLNCKNFSQDFCENRYLLTYSFSKLKFITDLICNYLKAYDINQISNSE